MTRRRNDDPVVIPFRPRPKPPKPAPRWHRSAKFFAILCLVVGVLRAAYAGMDLDWTDALFVILLAGALTLGDHLARRG